MNLEALETHPDERGLFVEAYKLPHDGQISYVIINPYETRGNHFHTRKTEKFLVVGGSAIIKSRDRVTGDVMKVEVSGFKPIVVTIPPDNTHSITATDEGCICMIWCDEQYDEKNPDTVPEEF